MIVITTRANSLTKCHDKIIHSNLDGQNDVIVTDNTMITCKCDKRFEHIHYRQSSITISRLSPSIYSKLI